MNKYEKWMILDGPINALWVESINTVLDDNKKLCLTNSDLIPMANDMSIIMET